MALARIYEATKSTVYGFALSILKNKADAEDVMHDTYIQMFRNAASYQPMGKPLAWLLTITKRLAYNRLRDEKYPEDIAEHEEAVQEHGTTQAEDRMLVDMAFEILEQTEREIVLLHAVSGMKHREIAELLDMNLNSVLSKYNRALSKMKKELERKGVAR